MPNIEVFLKELGQRIADLRNDAGLTQLQLGKKVGLSQQIIASYENGKRNFPIGRLLELAEALDVAPDKLLLGATTKGAQHTSLLDEQLAEVRNLSSKKRQHVSELLKTVLLS